MGKASASSAAARIGMSYTRLRLVLLVGICGSVPRVSKGGEDEILLGDVIISKTIVQYDFGRQYPGKFVRKNTAEDNSSKPNKYVRNLLTQLETDRGRRLLKQKTARFLKELQAKAESNKYDYPGPEEDKLFEPSYRHRHHIDPTCDCSEYRGTSYLVCDDALSSSCEEVGCDESQLVRRKRLEIKRQLENENAQELAIYVGSFATGDKVMKSAEERDRIAKTDGIIAFEMEAGGVWEEVPCIVVKGVCDYADSHKNKKWQDFAAATAAAAMKALLERLPQTDKSQSQALAIRDGRGAAAYGMVQVRTHDGHFVRQQQGFMFSLGQQAQNQLPFHLMGQTPVVVIDARGKPLRLDLETIDSLEVFTEVLKGRFKDLGLKKIKRGEWFLQDHHTGQILDLTKPWGALMRPGLILDMTMIFRRRSPLSMSTQCPKCRFENAGDPQTQVMCLKCGLTYRRIEEIQDIDVSEEGSSSQSSQPPSTTVPAPNRKSEKKLPPPLPRPRPPPKPQDDEDDICRYSRVQVIDTNFRIQKARKGKALPGVTKLTLQDLQDPESLAAYLATVYGLPEEDCLVILQECAPQLLRLRSIAVKDQEKAPSNDEQAKTASKLRKLKSQRIGSDDPVVQIPGGPPGVPANVPPIRHSRLIDRESSDSEVYMTASGRLHHNDGRRMPLWRTQVTPVLDPAAGPVVNPPSEPPNYPYPASNQGIDCHTGEAFNPPPRPPIPGTFPASDVDEAAGSISSLGTDTSGASEYANNRRRRRAERAQARLAREGREGVGNTVDFTGTASDVDGAAGSISSPGTDTSGATEYINNRRRRRAERVQARPAREGREGVGNTVDFTGTASDVDGAAGSISSPGTDTSGASEYANNRRRRRAERAQVRLAREGRSDGGNTVDFT